MKKILLVFLVLVGLAQKASAVSFEDCVYDVLKAGVVGAAGSLALGAAGFTPVGVAAGSLAALWQASIGERDQRGLFCRLEMKCINHIVSR